MTLIVGIVARDSIVFGADSQTTYENSKDMDTNKIHEIAFKNAKAILGESGSVSGAETLLRKIRKEASETVVGSESVAIEFFERIIEPREKHPSLACVFMVGFLFKDGPVMLKVDSFDGVTVSKKSYDAVGVGWDVSRFVLKQALIDSSPEPFRDEAIAFTIYAILSAIDYSPHVGGDIRVSTLSRAGSYRVVPPEEIKVMEAILKEAVSDMRILIRGKLLERIQAAFTCLPSGPIGPLDFSRCPPLPPE